MYLSTFKEEGINNEPDLVIKSIFRLLFISPNVLTNPAIEGSYNREHLQRIRYNENVSKYVFIPSYHPPGYTLISKKLPIPEFRQALDVDFLFIESELFVEYLKITDTFTSVIGLN